MIPTMAKRHHTTTTENKSKSPSIIIDIRTGVWHIHIRTATRARPAQ